VRYVKVLHWLSCVNMIRLANVALHSQLLKSWIMAGELVLGFNNVQIFKVRMTCYKQKLLPLPRHWRDQKKRIRLNSRSLLIWNNQNIKIILQLSVGFLIALSVERYFLFYRLTPTKPKTLIAFNPEQKSREQGF